jgi:WD40 repeat protein
MKIRFPRSLLAAAVAAGALALTAVPALADSIAYVKDGNVWLSTSDGSRQYQVTFGGGYSDVSQADDGTMIALKGVRLNRLDRQGNVLADFDTPVSDTRPPGVKSFYGPFEPAISPSGDKLAYTYYYIGNSSSPGCYPPTCYVANLEGGTGYSHVDRQTAWDEPGLGKHSGWVHPSWIDNDNVMLSDPTHLPNNDVLLDTIGDTGQPIHDWFSDQLYGNPHMSGGEMTRQKSKMAFLTGENDSHLRIYKIVNFPTGQFPPTSGDDYPILCFEFVPATGDKFAGTPTWSPDGSRLAWGESDGVKVINVPDLSGGCTEDGLSQTASMLIPGATEPDWGPADVPPARPDAGSGSGSGGGGSSKALQVTIAATKVKAALKHGLKVKVSVPSAGRLSAGATKGRKTVASGRKKVARGGAQTLTLRFTNKGRRMLAHAHNVKLTVKTSFLPKGKKKAIRTTSVVTLG